MTVPAGPENEKESKRKWDGEGEKTGGCFIFIFLREAARMGCPVRHFTSYGRRFYPDHDPEGDSKDN
jgi:hypothetical protein